MDNLQKKESLIRQKDTVTLQSELKHAESVERFVMENQSEFHEMDVADYLNQLLIKYNLEKCDVTRRGGFAGNYLYQIFNGKKNPSRDKLIQIALGFPLTLEETQELLKRGGYSELYVRDSRDAFLMFAIEKKYLLRDVNELLYKNNKKIIE
ncbi:MAG: XRE family transcriptional regulator [Lachnospiraceae bacterium]|nr:XRE family transcriptional regulator [Lachnospiraceae bacterium]